MANTLIHTIPEVAKILACSRPHVYALIASGRLKTVDIATPGSARTKFRVRRTDLIAFINSTAETSGNGHGPAPKETTKVPGQHDLTEGV
jgi:excisionase family DNA binding protein